MRQSWFDIGLSFIAAYLLGMVLFPERFLWFNATFIDYADSHLSYGGAFYVTESLYHGGVQLWNRYDQMPMTFFNMNFAMYKLSNVLTALFYAALSPFSQTPAELFHQIFSCVFIASALFVRVVGIYLLLGLFVRTRWMIILGTIYGALILSPQFIMALSTNIIYSLFPLMVYFLMRFFKELRFNHLFLFLCVWGYCVVTDLFCGLGYLYQGTHFVVIAGFAWMVIVHWKKFTQKDFFKALIKKEHLQKLGLLVALTTFILGPSLYLMKSHYKDYEFGVDNSRMKDPFSIKKYFTRPGAWAPQSDFLLRSVDFTQNLWSLNWLYVGVVTIFFFLLGCVTLKDSRKWIFIAAIVLFYLINCPRDSLGLGGVAHWINALTNPLKFLPRSYHMACTLLLPFLLLPMAVAGFEWFWQKKDNAFKLRLAWGLFVVFTFATFGALPILAKKAFIFFVMILILASLLKHRVVLAMLLILVGVVDAAAMSYYIRHEQTKYLVKPRPVLARPDLGLVSMEYQNPRILPVRHFGSLAYHEGIDTYLFESCTNMPGLMFRYTNFLRYYQRINNYLPRHTSFASWVGDGGKMQALMQQDLRLMTMHQPLNRKINSMTLNWQEATIQKSKGFNIYYFRIPKDLPKYYATTFLSPEEALFSVTINGQPLRMAQGSLVAPNTFDVNNVKDGALTIALPKGTVTSTLNGTLTYPTYGFDGLQNVFKNNLDDFGFIYDAPISGKLVLREPYDPKWKIYVDGNLTPFERVDQSFMAIELSKGTHQILMRYWPDTPIRFLFGLSIILSVLFFFCILIAAVREKYRER